MGLASWLGLKKEVPQQHSAIEGKLKVNVPAKFKEFRERIDRIPDVWEQVQRMSTAHELAAQLNELETGLYHCMQKLGVFYRELSLARREETALFLNQHMFYGDDKKLKKWIKALLDLLKSYGVPDGKTVVNDPIKLSTALEHRGTKEQKDAYKSLGNLIDTLREIREDAYKLWPA